ncbi:hypothetical protein RB614_13865 [Phytohabitans sp. ZYX-F-186]|uniref:Uncharacterized protein n=1 Tax=Phytohabitans maris TaxID=3071409 RepID=A0ABU0ZF49_9ACTN|nr:hypothetical protein [Phytohabitans sp. ZYX-F-186]MDQ7905603.1 hypothetical protein [Phytohabitans sp. ZYX-F-186]
MSESEYRRLVGALAAAARERDAALATAERGYQDGATEAAAALARAQAATVEAERRASAAAAAVVDVDREAGRVWDELRRAGGLWARLRPVGELPLPAPVDGVPAERAGADAVALIETAAKRIDQLRPGAPRAPLPRWLLPLLPPLGAAAATMTGLVAGGLVTLAHLDSELSWPLRLLGWVTFLLAPFTGLPPAALWVGRQFGSRLDAGAAGLIVLGGMAASCGLSLLFAR